MPFYEIQPPAPRNLRNFPALQYKEKTAENVSGQPEFSFCHAEEQIGDYEMETSPCRNALDMGFFADAQNDVFVIEYALSLKATEGVLSEPVNLFPVMRGTKRHGSKTKRNPLCKALDMGFFADAQNDVFVIEYALSLKATEGVLSEPVNLFPVMPRNKATWPQNETESLMQSTGHGILR